MTCSCSRRGGRKWSARGRAACGREDRQARRLSTIAWLNGSSSRSGRFGAGARCALHGSRPATTRRKQRCWPPRGSLRSWLAAMPDARSTRERKCSASDQGARHFPRLRPRRLARCARRFARARTGRRVCGAFGLLAEQPPGHIPPCLAAPLARGRRLLAAARGKHDDVETDLGVANDGFAELGIPTASPSPDRPG